ncbi:MAG: FtsX-like permease family protein [Armatimonadetes bacterium]|nr:FtsX-like permease family protein [Armatimonadota bacterium]
MERDLRTMINVRELAKKAVETRTDERIGRQIVLPWSAAFVIAMRHVTIRLGRAAITGSGVVLGIAFLAYIWTAKLAQDVIEQDIARRSRLTQVQQAATAGEVIVPGHEEAAEEARARTARQTWLVVMSLLVCAVGISNSMLMSVTERFREIGTMKCLGALDSFIVRLFLIESLVIGSLGSIIGAFIGHVGALLTYSWKGGWDLAAKFDWPRMILYLALSVVIGTFIAFIAAILPATRAAQMPAAAALRSEI